MQLYELYTQEKITYSRDFFRKYNNFSVVDMSKNDPTEWTREKFTDCKKTFTYMFFMFDYYKFCEVHVAIYSDDEVIFTVYGGSEDKMNSTDYIYKHYEVDGNRHIETKVLSKNQCRCQGEFQWN